MKYIIDVPDEYENDYISMSPVLGKEFCYPIRNMNKNKTYVIPTGLKIEPYTEPDEDEIRQKVENEVWDFSMKTDFAWISEVGDKPLGDYSYQEAKAKYEEWKKEKEQFCVGDEVVIVMDDIKAVVLDKTIGKQLVLLTENGCVELYFEKNLEKTGRHFDEIEELLKKMGEES